MSVVDVEALEVHFPITSGIVRDKVVGHVRAVAGVSFAVEQGETLGLVGESGCGKSTTGRALLGLVRATGGTARLAGEDVTRMGGGDLRRLRSKVQMIFQDPLSSLNPRRRIGKALAEPLLVHGIAESRRDAERQALALLTEVGLPADAAGRYPHELSGGQLQRVGIARALAVRPAVIVADEPVSALDVSIQAQILGLLERIQAETGVALLFIGHDLAVVKHISDRIGVMYLGRIVELASADELFRSPRHPYTAALLSAIPVPDPVRERRRSHIILQGDPPAPTEAPPGCPFQARCPLRRAERCGDEVPELRDVGGGRLVACHYAEELAERGALRAVSAQAT